MTNSKTTKRALLSSAVALLVCFSMLLGTTFAWFTDEASTTVNTIQSGTLDVALVDEYGTSLEGKKMSFENKDNSDKILWEPGVTFVSQGFKVVNNGNLALKYKLVINGVDGDAELLEAIDFWLTTNKDSVAHVNSDAVKVNLNEEFALNPKDNALIDGVGNESVVYYLVGHMKEEAGNEYQGLTLDGVGITVYATQVEAEFDSFDNKYDANATYEPWAGDVASAEELASITDTENKTVTISTAAQLAAFADAVNNGNTYQGYTVLLAESLNLNGMAWASIGEKNIPEGSYFKGTFDGQGNTIENLTAPLFGNINGTVKNLTIDTADIEETNARPLGVVGYSIFNTGLVDNVTVIDATVLGNGQVGGIVGSVYGQITNCTVKDSSITAVPNGDNGDKVGGIVGLSQTDNNSGVISGNTVDNVILTAYRDVGGIVGAADALIVTGNTVKNVTVNADPITGDYSHANAGKNAGEVVGSALDGAAVPESNNVSDTSVLSFIVPGVAQVGSNAYQVFGAQGLMNMESVMDADGVESFATYTLTGNVDMSGYDWTPIDSMHVIFDGNGYTISNLTVSEQGAAGLFSYLGGSTIKNLTLENVNISGNQAGAFAGRVEGGEISNCVLKGNNTITYVDDGSSYNGIGAIMGIAAGANYNVSATIDTGATVTLNKGSMETEGTYVDDLVGYTAGDYTNSGTVTNKGTVSVSVAVSSAADLKSALAAGVTNINVAGDITLTESLNASNVTLVGITDDAAINFAGYNIMGNGSDTITYKDLTLTTISLPYGGAGVGERYGWYGGIDYARHATANYENCTISGIFTLYSKIVNVTGCTFLPYVQERTTFNQIFQYGTQTANIEDCTFYYSNRAIKIYNEGGTKDLVMNVTGCTFKADESFDADYDDNKSLISIDPTFVTSVKLTVKDVSIDDALNAIALHNGASSDKITVTVE